MQQANGDNVQFRLATLERDVAELKQQLNRYVPARENDLELKSIRDIVGRIENDVMEARHDLQALNGKIVAQDQEAQRRDVEQREAQASLQIKVLWGVVSVVITVLTAVLIAFLTHLFR